MPLSTADPTSFSLPDQHVVKHIHLEWNVDFQKKIIDGTARLEVDKVNRESNQLILDVNNIIIKKVSHTDGKILSHKVEEEIENIGAKLTIFLSDNLPDRFNIIIEYESSPSASGLQWLEPLQTAGKQHPYLFSQFQAIHARSVIPCQDTPAVKFTYSAQVTVLKEFTVLMSALSTNKINVDSSHLKYCFNQPIPIPAYLIAIAVGDLEARKLGPRSTVWAEKEVVDKCAWEFAETEKMLKTAEEICGPYIWGVYDLLVLPPSFPYGGMENPCLTFVTPTLLAGDRSLADVIVHEISHSWTGNLVTNRNFEHFWLNEGFTMFVERKILSRLASDTKSSYKHKDFHTILGLESLKEAIFGNLGEDNPLTKLVVDLKGLNPDDSFSIVPYEKGCTFLRYIEDVLGGPDEFEPFLRHYLNIFRLKSIDTDDFKNLLEEYFKGNKGLKEIEWKKWLYTPGMPLHIPTYDTTLSNTCIELAKRWVESKDFSNFSKQDIANMNSLQLLHFLSNLHGEDISLELIKNIEKVYSIDKMNNAEIKCKWLRLCIKVKWNEKIDEALRFVNEQGRMKYVRPIYRDLYKWDDAKERAIQNFLANEKYTMHMSAYGIRKDLHLS